MPTLAAAFRTTLRALERDNSSGWMRAHREEYQRHVTEPFRSLVGELLDTLRPLHPELIREPAEAIFRPQRDVRFSANKAPYQIYVAANLSPFGKRDKSFPGFYLQLSASGGTIISGVYHAEPPQLAQLRRLVVGEKTRLAKMLSATGFRKHFPEGLEGEVAKRLPPEFQPAIAAQPLVAHKQFYCSAKLPASAITAPTLVRMLREQYAATLPLCQFLAEAY
jgi:uncharacterized protein (TIGR02453 family)